MDGLPVRRCRSSRRTPPCLLFSPATRSVGGHVRPGLDAPSSWLSTGPSPPPAGDASAAGPEGRCTPTSPGRSKRLPQRSKRGLVVLISDLLALYGPAQGPARLPSCLAVTCLVVSRARLTRSISSSLAAAMFPGTWKPAHETFHRPLLGGGAEYLRVPRAHAAYEDRPASRPASSSAPDHGRPGRRARCSLVLLKAHARGRLLRSFLPEARTGTAGRPCGEASSPRSTSWARPGGRCPRSCST